MSKIAEEFEVHMLNDEGKKKAVEIAEAFTELLNVLEEVCTPGADFDNAVMKLQEASFYAKRSMAVDNCV